MGDKIGVLIMEKYPLLQLAFESILEKSEEVSIVGVSSSKEELMILLKEKKPDIIIVDSDLSEELLSTEIPDLGDIKLILLSIEGINPKIIRKTLQYNFKGYITIGISLEEFVDAIKTVYRGETYIAKEVILKVLEDYAFSAEKDSTDMVEPLTGREREVLSLLSQGLTNKEIANSLGISEKTVKTHLTNIFGKLEVSSRLEAVLKVTKNNPAHEERINPS